MMARHTLLVDLSGYCSADNRLETEGPQNCQLEGERDEEDQTETARKRRRKDLVQSSLWKVSATGRLL